MGLLLLEQLAVGGSYWALGGGVPLKGGALQSRGSGRGGPLLSPPSRVPDTGAPPTGCGDQGAPRLQSLGTKTLKPAVLAGPLLVGGWGRAV